MFIRCWGKGNNRSVRMMYSSIGPYNIPKHIYRNSEYDLYRPTLKNLRIRTFYLFHYGYQFLFIPVKQPCGAVSLLILEGRAKVIGARAKITTKIHRITTFVRYSKIGRTGYKPTSTSSQRFVIASFLHWKITSNKR